MLALSDARNKSGVLREKEKTEMTLQLVSFPSFFFYLLLAFGCSRVFVITCKRNFSC